MESYSRYNIAVVLFAAFGSLFCGYSSAVISQTVGQPTFYTSLHLQSVPKAPGYSHTSTILGAVNGIWFAGGFFGTFFSGQAGDKLGRVNGFRLAATIGIIGSVLQTASVNQGMYLLARFVTGLATGHAIAAMPTYFSEIAPPHSRGLMTGAHGVFINFGYFLAGWVGFGCFHAQGSTFSWRFPNAVLVLIGLCFLSGTFFIPESPRWLLAQGSGRQALQVLCKLHHDANDPEDNFAHRELGLIRTQLDVDRSANDMKGRWQLFTQQTYRRRLILGIMLMMGGQNVGILVIQNFNTLLYKSLGLTTAESLLVNAGYTTWALMTNTAGASISDRLGRRKALVIGFTVNTCMLAIATALIARFRENASKSYAAAAVAMLYLYGGAYGTLIDPNQWTVVSEIFPSHLRAEASSLAISSLFLVDTLWIELAPTAEGAIGWKYYLVFVALGTIHTIFLFFKLPETSGLALEEIDVLFGKEIVGHIADSGLENAAIEEVESSTEKSFRHSEAVVSADFVAQVK